MPGTVWSAPVPILNRTSYTVAAATLGTAAPYDISPAQVILFPPQLNEGTRVRLLAHGSYTATGTTTSLTWGFYMTAASTATVANPLVATSAVLGVSPATVVAAVTGIPWVAEYWGRISSVSAPGTSLTNAQIVGRGRLTVGSSLTAFATPVPIPQTLAAIAVNQTASPGFGMVTNIAQLVSVGVTVTTGTNFTSITTDELTCELLG